MTDYILQALPLGSARGLAAQEEREVPGTLQDANLFLWDISRLS